MRTFLLTLDYELFGNGSGDVFKHMIEPTKRLMDVADKYGVRYTFFFEVVEYWRLKEEWEKGNTMGYKENPIQAIEDQLKKAYENGHDVQLHIHPQWINAKWDNDHWIADNDYWRLGDFVECNEISLKEMLLRGKQTIEDLIRPINANYSCKVLRAGGYNIQPSERLVSVMKEIGLEADTSVYPGGKETGVLSRYDYTDVDAAKGYWNIEDKLELSTEAKTNMFEIPIVAFPIILNSATL